MKQAFSFINDPRKKKEKKKKELLGLPLMLHLTEHSCYSQNLLLKLWKGNKEEKKQQGAGFEEN